MLLDDTGGHEQPEARTTGASTRSEKGIGNARKILRGNAATLIMYLDKRLTVCSGTHHHTNSLFVGYECVTSVQ